MARKNRNTLRRYFEAGSKPSQEQFSDLIDSSLNMLDEGFSKSPEYGVEITLSGQHRGLLGFFSSSADEEPVWRVEYDSERSLLQIRRQDDAPAALCLSDTGAIGMGHDAPEHALDVSGVIRADGRIGKATPGRESVPADGSWHTITPPLFGCNAIEVMAGVGSKGTGRYAIMKATAMNAYNPSGFLFNLFGRKNRIKYNQAYYLARSNKMELRWRQEGETYTLQIRSHCDYGEGVQISYYLTYLWFDHDMSRSQPVAVEP